MRDAQQIRDTLAQFSGSDTFTKWSPLFRNDVLTEGAVYLAEECGAYWLMGAIASWQHDKAVKKEDFQVWILRRDPDDTKSWTLFCEDGNNGGVVDQHIEYSDFPLDSIKLFAVRNELGGVTIMIPNEY